ncbi:hypothetical protein B808_415 [Fructilactobacillus florum 8D]|uniref:Uncharacterized protein n=1 Tax=Fructilactobacillus florum 8D TaxID=1221538 RepID=W9EF22_9LACO|nr:hypothetical protein B807_378 [Fructilactobacillus florum 2F]ETO40677.1 hypothetical protein B808_415 [Fructilactobacillus florum 8D]
MLLTPRTYNLLKLTNLVKTTNNRQHLSNKTPQKKVRKTEPFLGQ